MMRLRGVLGATFIASGWMLQATVAQGQTMATSPEQATAVPKPKPKPKAKAGECEPWCRERYDGGMVGLRLSSTRVLGSDRDRAGVGLGLQLAGHNESYLSMGAFTWRSATFFHIGGGSRGFEGAIGGDVAWGYRAPVAKTHGPFVRAGLRGWLLGNRELYSSYFEFPQVQLGYDWIHDGDAVEFGLRGGPVLVGRYNTGYKGMRKLGDAFQVGGYAAAHLKPIHLELGLTHIMPDSVPGGDVDQIEGRVCGEVLVMWLCVDTRYYHAQNVFPVGHNMVNAFYSGFSIGAATGAAKKQ